MRLIVLSCLFLLSSCGILVYPGQPGVVTNGYSKIDFEYLDASGLFVYEVSYDNRAGGKGVAAIITKFYPAAMTYTSNVRTNADGTRYLVKGQYEGAEVHMIALPQQNQVLMPPNSKVAFFMEFLNSLDETDDKNIAEQNLFKPSRQPAGAYEQLKLRLDLMSSARLTAPGQLAYELEAIGMKDKKFQPSEPIRIETNFHQNGARAKLGEHFYDELTSFVEAHFPTGFRGMVAFYLKGRNDPFILEMGVHTVKTAQAAGIKIIRNLSQKTLHEMATTLMKGSSHEK